MDLRDGLILGFAMGFTDGLAVDFAVGFVDGLAVGFAVGFEVGCAVGFAVGFNVGFAMGLGGSAAWYTTLRNAYALQKLPLTRPCIWICDGTDADSPAPATAQVLTVLFTVMERHEPASKDVLKSPDTKFVFT